MKKKVLFLIFFIFIVASCGKKADPQFKESKFILLSKKITV
tara:strand:+ start:161 stop:283 length:123 start_codon:yes stop_codon:yes gene_type:complete